jgi:RNA polymerase sigma factor (sigma-70 family)
MTEAYPATFPHRIRRLIEDASAPAMTDGSLLERFLTHRDETAVEVLVRRYGPLVFGVCRRVLRDVHAAEDAFQATFLVLVRKAPSLERDRPLGNWLYTVAYRLALRARADEARRERYEELAARARPTIEGQAPQPSDLVVALEEELHRLPERLRAPLVLCYLDGKTNEQAAAVLGCPPGSMSARLARARERLRECLARRGLVVPTAAIVAALAAAASTAAPLPLLDNTVRVAVSLVGGEACATGVVSARALALARAVLKVTFLNHLKVAAALMLAAVMLGTGAILLWCAAPLASEPPSAAEPQHPEGHKEGVVIGGAPADRRGNAALQYTQAFLALRRGVGDEGRLNTECLTMPLDAHARETLTKLAYALRLMQRGADLPSCNWYIDSPMGIDIPYRPGEGALLLGSLACLRARLRFEEGKSAAAIDDLLAAMALGRHVSHDGTINGLWAGYAIEHRASQVLALHLASFDSKTVAGLKKQLSGLPPVPRAGLVTLRMEQALLDWIVGEVKEARSKEELEAFMGQLGPGPKVQEKKHAEGIAILAACGGTTEGVLRHVEEVRRHSAALAAKLDLSPDQVAVELEREAKRLAGNQIFKVFGPVVESMRARQACADVRRSLLSAAIDVQLDGRDVLKKHPDPVLGGPLELVPFAGGFELRSKLKQEDKPVALTVGRRGK